MATGDMPDVAAKPAVGVGSAAKPTSGDLPPSTQGVEQHVKDLDPWSGLREAAMTVTAPLEKAWDYTVPAVTGALAVLSSRVQSAATETPENSVPKGTPGMEQKDGKWVDPAAAQKAIDAQRAKDPQRRGERERADAASESAFQKVSEATSSPASKIYALAGWHPEGSAGIAKTAKITEGLDKLTTEALDTSAKAVATHSAGWVTEGEANDMVRVVTGFMSFEGLKGGVTGLKTLSPEVTTALHADLMHVAESAKYKATKGSAEPLKEAVQGMEWSGVKPEHQAALEAEVMKALNEQEKKTAEPPAEKTPGHSLSALAEMWQKDPEVRSPEEHTALKKYFKDGDGIPEEAQSAIEATMKPLEELTAKDKSLLKKYAPAAAAATLGMVMWNQADASDGATDGSAMTALMALGIPLGLKLAKTIGEVRSGMSGPSLKFIETLPEKTKDIGKQQLGDYLRRPDIAGPEKLLLQKIHDAIPDGGKIPAEKLVDSLGPTLAQWELEAESTDKHKLFGLTNIDRINPRGAETILYKLKGENSFQIPDYVNGKVARNHFLDTPGVFGHVRRFVEDGVKHVAELQSDAFQQLSKTMEKADPQQWAAVKAELRSQVGSLTERMGFDLTQERVYLRGGLGTTLMKARGVFNNAAEHLEDLFKKIDYEPGRKWIDQRSQEVNNALTEDELGVHFGRIIQDLKGLRERAEAKVEGTDPAKKWDAVSERLKPMAKLYYRRLVREELSDSFRQQAKLQKERKIHAADGDPSAQQRKPFVLKDLDKQIDGASKVRFASAETVAKVEGWQELQVNGMKVDLKEHEHLLTEYENGHATEADLERFDHTLESLRENIEKMTRAIEISKKKLAADPTAKIYNPEHQGIFDRYKKEMEPFLRSIGGNVVKDKDGHSWFEVPVENKGLGLGPRAHMAGSVDPKMVGMLAGASLGAILGYKYSHSAGDSILGAMLGAGAVALGPRLFRKSLAGTDAVKASVRELQDMLYTVVQGSKADGLDLLNYVKRGLPQSYAAHAEAIANHLDNPRKFPIAGEAKRLHDDLIRPIQQANHAMVKALKTLGIETEDIIPGRGARRYFQGTSKGLSGLGQELERGGRVGHSRTLSTHVSGSTDQAFSSYKTMSGQEFIGKLGKNGSVDIYQNGSVVGKGQWNAVKQEMDYVGLKFKAARPKMEDVELHTKLKYEREPLLAEMDANLRLKSALANAYFLDNFKKMPGFSNLGFKPEPHEIVPEGWHSVPQLPGMRGYKFEPRIAEALEDFAGDQSKGFWHYASKMNRIFVGSMFWTPFLHIGNVAVHALQEKGAVGAATGMFRNLRTSMEAYKEVSQIGPKYRAYLRDGGSFMYPDRMLGDFNQNLMKALGKDQKNGGMIAQAFGYANPLEMVRRLYKMSGDSLWKWNDVFMMQGYLDKEAKGLSREDAMRKTEAHVPSYRIPSRVLDSRALSVILSENGPLSFARYDYGRLKSYGETIRDLVGKDRTLGDRAHALDQLAMLGLIMVGYEQLGDRVAQWLTQNDNASMMRLGSAAIPQMLADAWSGEADKRTPVVNLFHLSPVFELLPQVVANKDLYTGQDWAKTPGDAAMKTAEQLSPVKLATDTTRDRNPTSPASVFWAQLGVRDPSQETVDKKSKRKEKRLEERAK